MIVLGGVPVRIAVVVVLFSVMVVVCIFALAQLMLAARKKREGFICTVPGGSSVL